MAINRYEYLPQVETKYGKTENVFDQFDQEEDGFWSWVKETAGGTGSAVLDILHELGRPGSAVLSGIKEAGATFSGPPMMMAGGFPAPKRDEGSSIGDILSAMKKGFTYETETRGQDFLSEDFRKNNPVSAFGLGFLIDVLSDPLTFGASKAITVPVGKAAEGLVKLGGKSQSLTNMAERMSSTAIADALGISWGDAKKIRELSTKFRDKVKGSALIAERNMKIRNNQLEKIAEKAGVSKDELMAAITDDIETGAIGTRDSLTRGISAEAEKYALEDKQIYDELLRMEQESGIQIADILNRASELGIEGYVPHVATAAARKASQFKGRINDPVTQGSALKRQHEGTIREINERMADKTEKFMNDNPALLRALRESRSANEIAFRNFNDEVKAFGSTIEDLKSLEGGAPTDWISIPGIEGYKFPPNIAKIIINQRNVLTDTVASNKFFDLTDKVQGIWKTWSLGVRPSYHARNFVGNMWNAYTIAGVKNPKVFDDARKMQVASLYQTDPSLAKYLGAIDETGKNRIGKFNWDMRVVASDGSTKSYKEIFDAAVERGVLGKGQYGVGSDITFNLERQLESAVTSGGKSDFVKSLFSPLETNPILRTGFAVGNVVEDNARLAIFLDTFKKTGSFEEASSMVKKALFDYSDLSSFEKTYMKRLMPFYTWSRKNIPAQLEALYQNPERARKLDIFRTQAEYEQGRPDPQNVYDFYNKGVPIYMSKEEKDEVWKLYRMLNYIPLADLERMSAPDELIGEMITPLIKQPLEQLQNYDMFRKKQIEQYKGQTTDFLGIAMPARMAHLAQLLVPIAEMNRVNPFGMFGEATRDEETGEFTRTKSWGLDQPLVEFNVPDMPGPLGIASGNYQFGGTPRESGRDQEAGLRLLQYTLGLRPYYVSEGKGREYSISSFNKDVKQLNYYLNEARRKGMARRANELMELISQWEASQKQAERDKKMGKTPDFSFRGAIGRWERR